MYVLTESLLFIDPLRDLDVIVGTDTKAVDVAGIRAVRKVEGN